MYVEQLTQDLAFCTEIDPQVINNTTKNTGAINMAVSHRAMFVLNIGAVTSGGSITATLQMSANGTSGWTSLPCYGIAGRSTKENSDCSRIEPRSQSSWDCRARRATRTPGPSTSWTTRSIR